MRQDKVALIKYKDFAPRITEMLQPTALMEATTWYRHPKTGKVELVAAQPAKTSSTATCAAKY